MPPLKEYRFEDMMNSNVEVKAGTHKQFVLNTDKNRVECRCGHVAILWKTGYLCGTIMAYPCRFN